MGHLDFARSAFVKTPIEVIQTAITEQELPKLEAINSAKILYGLFHTMQIAELIGILAYNVQHNLGNEAELFDSPLPLGEADTAILASRKLVSNYTEQTYRLCQSSGYIVHPNPELTPHGIVAANMYALDTEKLAEDEIVPYLREPFAKIQILDMFSQAEDELTKTS